MPAIFTSPVIWVLLATSVVALAIIIERFYVLQRITTGGEPFVEKVKEMLGNFPSSERIEAARLFCKQERQNNLSARVLELIFSQVEKSYTELERISALEREKIIPFLEKRLIALSTISAIAPLLGLLGTVVGMIKAFVVIAQGNIEGSSLAGGISEALISTAIGLIVAIPCIITYNYFLRKVEQVLHDVEIASGEILRAIKY